MKSIKVSVRNLMPESKAIKFQNKNTINVNVSCIIHKYITSIWYLCYDFKHVA